MDILLRKIVSEKKRFFLTEVTGICLIITPGCFNIQTSSGFENFCLISSNCTYLVQNQVIYFQYVYNCVFSQIPGLMSLPLTLTAQKKQQKNKHKIFGRQDVLHFFSWAFKDYKYVKSQKAWSHKHIFLHNSVIFFHNTLEQRLFWQPTFSKVSHAHKKRWNMPLGHVQPPSEEMLAL